MGKCAFIMICTARTLNLVQLLAKIHVDSIIHANYQ